MSIIEGGRTTCRGFTLVEIVVTIIVLGIVSAFATAQYLNLKRTVRIAALNDLAGNVRTAMNFTHNQAIVTNNIGASGFNTFVTSGGVTIRLWNGWPDRWWDGIGITLEGATPLTGGYSSVAPFTYQTFTFYGFGNTVLPGGLAGWATTNASTPGNCSVTYGVDGTGAPPPIVITSSGC